MLGVDEELLWVLGVDC